MVDSMKTHSHVFRKLQTLRSLQYPWLMLCFGRYAVLWSLCCALVAMLCWSLCCAGHYAVLYLAVHAMRHRGLPLVQHMTQAQQLQVSMQADQHGLDNLNMSHS